MTIHRLYSIGVAVGLALISASAQAQEFAVQGASSSNDVTLSTNTSTAQQDRKAVHGVSKPAANWGVGGLFEGGWVGVQGIAAMSGAGNRYAGKFEANYGATNYGVYASAPTTAGSYAGYFAGNVYVSGSLTQASDLKLKTNVQDLQGSTLAQVLRLRPKAYRYAPSVASRLNLPTSDQVGLVAQDVALVFPNLVQEVTVPSTEKGGADEKFLSVDYVKIVPLVIKALQEQQAQINTQQAQIIALKAQVDALGKR